MHLQNAYQFCSLRLYYWKKLFSCERDAVPGNCIARTFESRRRTWRAQTLFSGSTSKAAKILGVSPRTIQYRMNQYRDEDPEQVALILARKKTKKKS